MVLVSTVAAPPWNSAPAAAIRLNRLFTSGIAPTVFVQPGFRRGAGVAFG